MRHNGEDRRPEEIEAEIERTRAEMDATLHAIEGRLSPGQLVDQGLDYLRHSGANEFVSNLGESVKHNPLPVTLVGFGLAWLMMADRLPRRTGTAERSGHMGQRASEAMHRASGAAHTIGDRASGAARSVGERVSGTTQAARESISHAAASARERAGRMSELGQRQFQRARGGYEHMLREQPLALGALGVAIGAAVAAAVPRTRREDELMGEARDRLAEQARQAGREQLDKAERVAAAARDAATEEARREGLATASPSSGSVQQPQHHQQQGSANVSQTLQQGGADASSHAPQQGAADAPHTLQQQGSGQGVGAGGETLNPGIPTGEPGRSGDPRSGR